MKKNLLAVFFAGCGMICAQAAWSADSAPLPSALASSSKTPIKFSVRVETSSEEAVVSCNKIIKFYIYDFKPFSKSDKNGPPWVVEMSKEYESPYSDADKIIKTMRGSPCAKSGNLSWTVSQETTIRENAKAESVKPDSAKPKK